MFVMLWGHVCEGGAVWQARKVTYQPSSWPNGRNRDSLPCGWFYSENRQCNESCHTVAFALFLAVLWQVLVVNAVARNEEPMNSSLLRWCSWLSFIFYIGHVCVIWGYLGVPRWYKKSDNVMPLSNVAHVAWHWQNLLKFDAERKK